MTTFQSLGLHRQLLKAISAEGYEAPSPIQADAIPLAREGRDVLGIAQTGTGKTAAFALPTLNHLLMEPKPRTAKSTRILVLAPTRELAGQIADNFRTYSKYMDCVVQTVFGGVKIGRQVRSLGKGTHVLVATPGRLVDLMNQQAVRLDCVEHLILDEADQMLDMGFIHDLRKIIAAVPNQRQTLLFSATMPKAISDLAAQYLNDPVTVSVAQQATTAERVRHGVHHVSTANKMRLLEASLAAADLDRALVFTRTKHGADKVVRKLMAKGFSANAIHGNKSQPQRKKALDAFRDGRCQILVATDIAARGIDIDGISHVVNFEMPNVSEQYVHRIGRTARAGRDGIAISLVAEDEVFYLREIEKTIRAEIDVLPAPEGCEDIIAATPDRDRRVQKPKGPARGRGGRQQASSSGRPRRARPKQQNSKPSSRKRSSKPRRANERTNSTA